MSDQAPLEIELTAETQAMMERMAAMPEKMLQAIARGLDWANELAIGNITRDRMSGKGPFPANEGKMGVKTGQMRASLRRARAVVLEDGAEGGIGSNLRYMGPNEFGFQGTVHVQPYLRRVKSRDNFERQTRIAKSGRAYKAKVRTATGVAFVRGKNGEGFDRHMNIPARHPIGHGVADTAAAGTYDRQIMRQLRETWEA